MRLWFSFSLIYLLCACLVRPALADETRVGGHFRFGAFDYVDGQHNSTQGSQSAGFSVQRLYLFITQEISETLSVDLQPEFEVRTGATPKLKNDIGAQRISPSLQTWSIGLNRAEMRVYLPYELTFSTGMIKPRFTWDYGAEYFWSEEYHASKFSADYFLGCMHDVGACLERTFELPQVTLPVSLYVINGGSGVEDTNRNLMTMVHVEPSLFGFRLLGSYAYGKWDTNNQNDVQRYSAGLEYIWNAWSLRSEYAGGIWKNGVPQGTGFRDATPFGYYVKLMYRISPWMNVMVDYSLADHNFNSYFAMAPGAGEKYTTLTPTLQILPIKNSLIILQYDRADWRIKDDSDILRFNRFVLSWKNTF